ncbi:MAG: fibronectin type III domain-containing protein [Actinobacteria bacterium]|nr:fibronectin type III domain-containing protein [Actinomycetota bacterium]
MRKALVAVVALMLLVAPASPAFADDGSVGFGACQPGITATPTDMGGTSVLVVATPAVWGLNCTFRSYSVQVTNTTSGVVLDSVSNWLLSYQKTFTLPRGSTLSAVITQGSGSADAEVTIQPLPPGAPTSVVAPAATSTSISLQWAAPADDGGSPVTGYAVTWQAGSLQTTDTALTVNGLLPSTTYVFAVTAVNSVGSSLDATVTATTAPAGPDADADADADADSLPEPVPLTAASAQPPTGDHRRAHGGQRRQHGRHSRCRRQPGHRAADHAGEMAHGLPAIRRGIRRHSALDTRDQRRPGDHRGSHRDVAQRLDGLRHLRCEARWVPPVGHAQAREGLRFGHTDGGRAGHHGGGPGLRGAAGKPPVRGEGSLISIGTTTARDCSGRKAG